VTDSIIEQIRDPNRFSMANEHILRILGERRIPKPIIYRHKESGLEYCYLAGGLGWPRDPKEKPGFAVVVGVDKPDAKTDEKPTMRCLEEAESPTVDGLLKEAVRLQKKYGAVECEALFRILYAADPERSDTFVHLFNHETPKDPDRVYVVGAYDHDKPNAFERYVNQIFSSLTDDPTTGKKRLQIGGCVKLLNYLQTAPVDVATKGSAKEYPALSALGGLIHTLMMLMPWTEFLKPERTVSTINDPLNDMQEDYDWWESGSHDYDEQEEFDDGALVGTV